MGTPVFVSLSLSLTHVPAAQIASLNDQSRQRLTYEIDVFLVHSIRTLVFRERYKAKDTFNEGKDRQR